MTYKVVYNACYGGFGLSKKGALWIYKRLPKETQDEVQESSLRTLQYLIEGLLPRHSPLLVEMVETLGEQGCAGYARLRIKEIDSPMYRIDEYDGKETVITPAENTWIVIE